MFKLTGNIEKMVYEIGKGIADIKNFPYIYMLDNTHFCKKYITQKRPEHNIMDTKVNGLELRKESALRVDILTNQSFFINCDTKK